MKKQVFCRLAAGCAFAVIFLSTVDVSAEVLPTMENWGDNGMENVRLAVVNDTGKTVFEATYSSPGAQLSHYQLLVGDKDYFYFIDNGAISAFDNNSGERVWTNYDFNGSCCDGCFAVDDDNTLYLCGYMGPDLFAVDCDGNTIIDCSLETDTNWPYKMNLLEDGTLDITYEMDESTLNIDPKAYEGCIEAEDNSFPGGLVMTVCNCNEWISLRTGPNTSADRITTIPLGAEVTYFRNANNGFYKVEYNGICGYALAEYLK